ncbi:type II and III secretion system protein family protein [Advenella sp. RU8]|uniref:type II and III secretion system protein family protein n=1 Tax=Advenella sp. RU8 TaxID=3399575 RepID=UPI003AB09DE9
MGLAFISVSPVMAQSAGFTRPGGLGMVVDTQRMLKVNGSPARIAVGNPDVVDVQILPLEDGVGDILLVAKKPGVTDVQVWVDEDPEPKRWQVSVVSGEQRALESAKRLEAPVRATGGQAVVTGKASNMVEHQRSTAAARATGASDKIIDTSVINTSGMVQVEVKVVELSRSVMKDVGIDWNTGTARAGGSGTWGVATNMMPAGLGTSGFSLFFDSRNFGFKLQLLEQNGMARTLAEPTLVALSGQSASFRAGGEIPVPEAGGLGTQTVSYKPFGIGLTVTPTVLSPQRIALKVAPESSELDYANAIPVVSGDQTTLMPALRVRKADTTVEMGDGESYIISGLVSRQTMANVSKMPFLSDLPIIGSFFRNVSYSQDERELVIVVTPRLIKPIAKGTELPLPGQGKENLNEVGTAWGYYLVGPASGEQMPGFSR